MSGDALSPRQLAVEDFKRMRRQAVLQQVLARLTGRDETLLPYNEVVAMLRPAEHVERGLQEIPLKAIVGSVGRYHDFTRSFLPKSDANQERWARVKEAVVEMRGLNPIEVYQVSEVYFVKDGNHRVSVARQLGAETISAYVTEVKTRVTLTADDDPTQVICKARYADFLQKSNLDRLRPEADLLMTYCGEYDTFWRQILTHHSWLQSKRGTDISFDEAVAGWYDDIYRPVTAMIHEHGLERNFPKCTEADLYILLLRHWESLQQSLGWQVKMETAVADMAGVAQLPRSEIQSTDERPGEQRQLFREILLATRDTPADHRRLAQAIVVAQRENGRLLGLHIVSKKTEISGEAAQRTEAVFREQCQAAGVPHDFAVAVGPAAAAIVKRAAWADLVIAGLNHPPGRRPLARLSSGFNSLVQRCPRPILALPGKASPMDNGLLAYDGSPKADEALYVAAYLALRWRTRLTVITVETAYTAAAASDKARDYLAGYGIAADYVLRQGEIGEAILATAVDYGANLIIMGGFGFRPTLQLALGSAVDETLRQFQQPILICR
jgi:nucleotide-binding universal stress UspA family protein